MDELKRDVLDEDRRSEAVFILHEEKRLLQDLLRSLGSLKLE